MLADEQQRLLRMERIPFDGDAVDISRARWRPTASGRRVSAG
jgi:hypothetical protein